MKLIYGVLLFVVGLVLCYVWAWVDTFDRLYWWGTLTSFMLFMAAFFFVIASFGMLCWAVYCIFNPKG